MKVSKGRIIFQCFNYTFLFLVMVICLYPILYVLAASVSNYEFLAKGKVGIIPMGFTLSAYKRILSYPMLGRAYFNTFFYTIAGTIISMLLSALAAYPLSRQPFPGQKFMSKVVVVAMLFSAGIVPTFLVVTKLHMYNTIWSILLPSAMSSFNVILLKNFFQQIPYELEESAALDGCSQMRILFKIILPLAMPGVVTVGLFYAVAQWNSYFPAMLYLRDRSLIPIQIILRDIVIQSQTTDLANFGIEGLTYTMVDGEPRYTDVIAKDTQGRSILSMLNVYGHREWAYQQDIRYEDALLDYNKEYIDYRNGMEKYIRPTIPALSFTEEERDVIYNDTRN